MAYSRVRTSRRYVGKMNGRRRGVGGYGRKRYKRSYGGRRGKGSSALRELQKRLAAVERGGKQKLELRGFPERIRYFVEDRNTFSKDLRRYLVLPVTQAIPPQMPGAMGFPSDAYRKSRKVRIRGVKLRFTVENLHGVKISAVAHRKGGGPQVELLLGPDGVPQGFAAGVKEGTQSYRMHTLEETGLLQDRAGPFEVETRRRAAMDGEHIETEFALGSVDGSIYECATVKGDGAPCGKVEFWTGSRSDAGFDKKTGTTANLSIAGKGVGGMAEQTMVTMYFSMDVPFEFEREELDMAVGNHIQVTLMVCSTASDLDGEKGMGDVKSGDVGNFLMHVYYV